MNSQPNFNMSIQQYGCQQDFQTLQLAHGMIISQNLFERTNILFLSIIVAEIDNLHTSKKYFDYFLIAVMS